MSDNYFYVNFSPGFVHNSMVVFEGLTAEDCIESSTLQLSESVQVRIMRIAHGVHAGYLFDCSSNEDCLAFAVAIKANIQKLLVNPDKVDCVKKVRLWGIFKTLQ